MDLAAAARYPVLIVNDADIRVPHGLSGTGDRAVVRSGRGAGHVPVPRRMVRHSRRASRGWASRPISRRRRWWRDWWAWTSSPWDPPWRSGARISTASADSRRSRDYLADDYQLGHRLHALGLKCVLGDVIVDTHLGGDGGRVEHQMRWARTIRVSKFAGYPGAAGHVCDVLGGARGGAGDWRIAIALLAIRMMMAIVAGWFVMRSSDVLRLFWAIPMRDLFGAAVWMAALGGNTVVWRGKKLKIDRQGRLQ